MKSDKPKDEQKDEPKKSKKKRKKAKQAKKKKDDHEKDDEEEIPEGKIDYESVSTDYRPILKSMMDELTSIEQANPIAKDRKVHNYIVFLPKEIADIPKFKAAAQAVSKTKLAPDERKLAAGHSNKHGVFLRIQLPKNPTSKKVIFNFLKFLIKLLIG